MTQPNSLRTTSTERLLLRHPASSIQIPFDCAPMQIHPLSPSIRGIVRHSIWCDESIRYYVCGNLAVTERWVVECSVRKHSHTYRVDLISLSSSYAFWVHFLQRVRASRAYAMQSVDTVFSPLPPKWMGFSLYFTKLQIERTIAKVDWNKQTKKKNKKQMEPHDPTSYNSHITEIENPYTHTQRWRENYLFRSEKFIAYCPGTCSRAHTHTHARIEQNYFTCMQVICDETKWTPTSERHKQNTASTRKKIVCGRQKERNNRK